jgi:hypothetical protein
MSIHTDQATNAAVLRTIPLSMIVVPEGHNPREHFDQDAQAAMNASVAERGLLQPVRVALTPTGDYALYLQ